MWTVSDCHESIFDAVSDFCSSDISVTFWKKVFKVSENA